MNKTEKDDKTGRRRIKLVAFLKVLLDGQMYVEMANAEGIFVPIYEKEEKNSLGGRRGEVRELSAKMGQSIKLVNLKTNKNHYLEARFGKEAFKNPFYKEISGRDGKALLYDRTSFLPVDKPDVSYYNIFTYSQVSDSCISDNIKGKGNANRINMNGLYLDPIPVNGWNGPLGRKLSLKEALENLF